MSGWNYSNGQAIGGKCYLAPLQRQSVVSVDFAPPACEGPDIGFVLGGDSIEFLAVCYELGSYPVLIAPQFQQCL